MNDHTKNKASLLMVGLLTIAACCLAQAKRERKHPVNFDKHLLCSEFVSEGVAVADVNNDGKKDIIAGAYWFQAPSWKQHELAPPQEFDWKTGYSNSFLQFALDVNQDGWMDVIRIDFPGKAVVWHENPGNKPGYWQEHPIYHALGNETPQFVDMDGDGRPDLIGNDPELKEVIWLKAPHKKGDIQWEKIVVSKEEYLGTLQFTHGLGVADLNRDGRPDILITKGWWEAPEDPNQRDWTFHPADFGNDCAQMYVMDVNQDGLDDVVSSSSHNYGIWWYEQQKDPTGERGWQRHVIDSTFSQSHALYLKDLNGDGHPDLITGKRFWAHGGIDPGESEPAVLYWYEYTPGVAPFWKSHRIDDDSGVGLHLVVTDINDDGFQDIIVSNKKGVHYFQQQQIKRR